MKDVTETIIVAMFGLIGLELITGWVGLVVGIGSFAFIVFKIFDMIKRNKREKAKAKREEEQAEREEEQAKREEEQAKREEEQAKREEEQAKRQEEKHEMEMKLLKKQLEKDSFSP